LDAGEFEQADSPEDGYSGIGQFWKSRSGNSADLISAKRSEALDLGSQI
jgi:hypothetical protein